MTLERQEPKVERRWGKAGRKQGRCGMWEMLRGEQGPDQAGPCRCFYPKSNGKPSNGLNGGFGFD